MQIACLGPYVSAWGLAMLINVEAVTAFLQPSHGSSGEENLEPIKAIPRTIIG